MHLASSSVRGPLALEDVIWWLCKWPVCVLRRSEVTRGERAMREAWAWPENSATLRCQERWGQGADIVLIQVRCMSLSHVTWPQQILDISHHSEDLWLGSNGVTPTQFRNTTNNYSGGCHCLVLLDPGHHYPPLHKSPRRLLIVPPWSWRGVSTVHWPLLCPGLSRHRRPPPLACCSHHTGPIVHWRLVTGHQGARCRPGLRRNKCIVNTDQETGWHTIHHLSHQTLPEKIKFQVCSNGGV